MKQPRVQRRTAQAGFTLIEALVALVVMSFGMLALAGMQIAMTRNSTSLSSAARRCAWRN